MSHTKGPWTWMVYDHRGEVTGMDSESHLAGASGDRVMTLGDCYPDGGQPNEADANLIAAAPDLLAALEMVLSALGGWGGDKTPLNNARRAIAKARGEK